MPLLLTLPGFGGIARSLLHLVRVMAVVPAVAVERLAAQEIFGLLVPAPEPGVLFLGALGLLAAVFLPLDVGLVAEHACAGASAGQVRSQERADVHPHAVVDVRLPADRLFVQRLPTDEDVEGGLASEDCFQPLLESQR